MVLGHLWRGHHHHHHHHLCWLSRSCDSQRPIPEREPTNQMSLCRPGRERQRERANENPTDSIKKKTGKENERCPGWQRGLWVMRVCLISSSSSRWNGGNWAAGGGVCCSSSDKPELNWLIFLWSFRFEPVTSLTELLRLVTAAVESFGATLTSTENLSCSSVAKYSQLTAGWSERR